MFLIPRALYANITNNVNKTWAILQSTGDKDEPNISALVILWLKCNVILLFVVGDYYEKQFYSLGIIFICFVDYFTKPRLQWLIIL